ncbi:twin transmembrane helix small protein [Comamonas endophytica]|uniref:Twin transmembrane helix small protein n=1 Tax=Comamonas endophytica TaxID=2949090 RepID=A0ABY6G6R6_9BURK|nr:MULTISPECIES: twin transmembrane helix small protein [unclassified Acidovorax]MCD2511320.1 twin transmembrane helix small protein [Acidovorax sp. D4N7]UYG50714.1 twin transmembrane helix small protein [Acidovorax sp. 5MLIR]
MLFMKIFIALAFLGILASLGSALFFMMRRPRNGSEDNAEDNRRRSQHMARALALRVGLSVLLFLCLLLSWKLGYIQPTGLAVGR